MFFVCLFFPLVLITILNCSESSTLGIINMTNICVGYSNNSSLPLSDLSSGPDPEWLPELDWLPAEEGGASRLLSSSLPWVRSPLSELLSESLRAEREEEVLLVSLRGLLEFRPGHNITELKKKCSSSISRRTDRGI